MSGNKNKIAILMRHGMEQGGKLTELSIDDVKSVAQQMIRRGIIPDVVLYPPFPVRTPLSRTEQTANAIVDAYKQAGIEINNVRRDEYLMPSFPPREPRDMRNALPELDNNVHTVLLVSHMSEIQQAVSI